MAEFKLGRIRFIWKGAWTTGTQYVRDDIVQYGGKTFICILAHTAGDELDIDLNDIQPKWEQFGDGVSWRADWAISTYYKVNDIVKNGGYLYVCNQGHESAATPDLGLEADLEKWDLFAEGISYQQEWSVGTKYRVNDIIKYGASTYICTNAHTAAATIADGLEANSSEWDLFSQGFDWKNNWLINTRYKLYDVVKYGGKLYLCIVGHTSAATEDEGLELNEDNWQVFSEGIEFLNDWTNNTRYKQNDVVKYGAGLWICIIPHTSTTVFADDEANWQSFLPGLEFENSWNSSTVYQPGDFVTYGGYSYVAKTNHTNSIPSTNPVDWAIYITGFNLIGDWDIATEYRVGDVVRVGGYTYIASVDNVGYLPPNPTYWKKLNEGFKWKGAWATTTDYDLGDVVRYNDFSYIAVQRHTSSTGDRPDVDTNGDYWNLMVSGTEENVLTTAGDLLYFGGAGPVRLGIGAPGQILKVNAAGDAPEWAYYGLVDNVYYVAPNGVNLPAPDYGTTSDKPWSTVAYACSQILNATINANAKYLLDNNVDFIAAEVVEWIDYQIANEIAPFTAGFTYDKTKCRRDMRQIVRHTAYDLSHGGNVESRKAAQSYFTDAGQTYISGQETETNAAINYGLDLMINAILANTAPAQNYQTLNGVGSPETQTIDLLYTSETGTDTLLTGLVGIVTTSISDGNLNNLPAEQVVNNTLFIKTGEYRETLPIVVPSTTALVGDELRSTRILPDSGEELKNMFLVRNGCGIRNMTLSGLEGGLSADNEYGTKRPTAGAFVSLDPGEGPDDRLAWVHNKSTYVQNVSTFGTGCIGLKVDGSLHDGGNDSIVANDFTQILSDGIGYWVTNLGRSELVSVFTYYNYIGYLSENGGKIRATNGNNSYGTFGSVAEGIDSTEVPITATVNNQYSEAIVDDVFTDGDRILTIEYVNAGANYTDATDAVTAFSLNDTPDNTRTPGIYNVSGTSTGTGTGQEFEITVQDTGVILISIRKGGTGHSATDTISFNASDIGGTGTGFTITVTEVGDPNTWTIIGEGLNAEIGQAVVRDGGISSVKMLNTDDNFGGEGYVTASNNAQTGNATSITIANTDGAATGDYNGMAIFIQSGVGAGQYGYISSYNAGSKIANILRVSDDTPGWDHLVPGTPIEVALDQTSNYIIEPRVTIPAPVSGVQAFARAKVVSEQIFQINIIEPGSGYDSLNPPTITFVDPNNTVDAPTLVKINDGVLGQPNWANRGEGYEAATIAVEGDGFADIDQNGEFVFVEGLTDIPQNGSNVEFINTPDLAGQYFKLVRTAELTGTPGNYKVRLQISPDIPVDSEPAQGADVEFRIRYSQVRLTGHDFLDIGTGNFLDTNYPNLPAYQPNPANETVEAGGGRVFYTSTDQDGNFRVGELFTVEQATGVATIDADNFSLSGLQELQLGSVGLGGAGAIINEFSTDGTFAANSDNIVPTQRAIRTFINSQIGGGLSTLNVNTLISGVVQIDSNRITTTTGEVLNITAPMNFEKGIIGVPLALQYFLT